MRLDLRGRRSYAETIECTEHHLFQTGDATGNPFDNVFEASIPIAPETMRATVTIDPKQPVANNWFRDGQFAAARKFLEPLST